MQENIKVNYMGQIPNEEVNGIYKVNHVAILLTFGENFGHSIAEALIGGCPVIISDKTPWQNLEKDNVGYDISLGNEKKIISAIEHFIEMNNCDYQDGSNNAFNYAKTNSNTSEIINSYFEMFQI